MADTFLTSVFEHKAWCNRRLVEALRDAPGDADSRGMSVILFTLNHTSIVDQIFRAHLSGVEHGFCSVVAGRRPDLGELAATLGDTDAWYLDYARRASPGDLEGEVGFTFVADGEQGRMSRAQMLAHVITHGASHRGAIGQKLADMKVAGAPDMVTTFQRSLPAER